MRIVAFDVVLDIPENIVTGEIVSLELKDYGKYSKKHKYEVIYYPSGELIISKVCKTAPELQGFTNFPQIKVCTIKATSTRKLA